MRKSGLLESGAVLVVLLGCGPSADDPCSPACGRGFECYFGVCVPEHEAGTSDGGDEGTAEIADDGADDGTPPAPGKLDLLFVIDNSSSMGAKQADLVGNFPALIDDLFDPSIGAVTDLNVGVISTDMGVGGYSVPTCTGNDDGVLLHDPRPGVPGCAPSYPTFLHAGTTDHGSPFAASFACIGTLGTEGCGFEQPFAAVNKALTVHSRSGGANAGFLRPDAALGVILLSDENDCSATDPSLFDPEAPDELRLRCVNHAAELTPVAALVDMLRGLRPGTRLAVGLLVGVPPSVGICNNTGDVIAPCLSEPTMREEVEPSTGSVRLVCGATAAEGATPGVRHVQLASALGARAVVRSICDPRYDTFFELFARMARQAP
ncbi:MAG: hypothetical protein HY907_01470 [Deltaproteobacteria bacterium]|nr:hypothetical protein [Deltaproteobacteria bacterium]